MMKNGMIIEVKNLGVPVQHPSKDNPSGSVLRWSSDPEVSPFARAHVIIGHAEFQRFTKLAIPEEFINKAAMTIHPILVEDGATSVSRDEAIDAGAHIESWLNVRTLLVIVGKNKAQPEAITKEWYGSRDDFFANQHILDGAKFATIKDISAPVIFTDNDVSKILNASSDAHHHLLTMNPALRTAKLMTEVLERSLANLDLDNINPDRAMHILNEIKESVIAHQEMKSAHNATFNLNSDAILGIAANLEQQETNKPNETETVAPKRESPGIRFH